MTTENSPDRKSMDQFKDILNEEIFVFDAMERLLSEKKDVLIRNDLDRLQQIDTQLESLADSAKGLDTDCRGAMVKLGYPGQTLKAVIENLAGQADGHELRTIRDRLKTKTERVQVLTRMNQDLLTQSIKFIEQSINCIASLLSPRAASYGPQAGSGVYGKKPNGQMQKYGGQNMATTIVRDV